MDMKNVTVMSSLAISQDRVAGEEEVAKARHVADVVQAMEEQAADVGFEKLLMLCNLLCKRLSNTAQRSTRFPTSPLSKYKGF